MLPQQECNSSTCDDPLNNKLISMDLTVVDKNSLPPPHNFWGETILNNYGKRPLINEIEIKEFLFKI